MTFISQPEHHDSDLIGLHAEICWVLIKQKCGAVLFDKIIVLVTIVRVTIPLLG